MGCGNRADRDRDISFVCLPATVTVKGEKFRKLTKRGRGALITAINVKDLKHISLKYTRVCSDHFVSVKSFATKDQANPD